MVIEDKLVNRVLKALEVTQERVALIQREPKATVDLMQLMDNKALLVLTELSAIKVDKLFGFIIRRIRRMFF